MQFTCSNIEADILSVDPENKVPFKLNRKSYNQMIEKGIHMEICYSPAIQDSTKRKNTISIAHLYHAFGKSKNIIVSSGAEDYYQIRGPYDIINLYPFMQNKCYLKQLIIFLNYLNQRSYFWTRRRTSKKCHNTLLQTSIH